MKTLKEMTNVEKGKLLADFFPKEIQGMLDAIEKQHYVLVRDKDQFTENWDNGLITVDFWYGLAHDVYSRVIRQRKQLTKSRRFADQLFDGYNSLFTIECIIRYADTVRRDSRFHYMVMAFFKSDFDNAEIQ